MKWISVEERLPEDSEDGREFICYTNATGTGKGVMSLQWDVSKVRGKTVRRWKWHWKICTWNVTHWMPLPEPPESKREKL